MTGRMARHTRLGRRLAAWLLDSAILLFVLFLVFITMKLFRVVGARAPAATRVPVEPVEGWKALGVSAKLFGCICLRSLAGPDLFCALRGIPTTGDLRKA